MWIAAYYQATTLFSLKPATATSSGGKTLLIPTPYTIKMALVDFICKAEGRGAAESVWTTLRRLTVAVKPASAVVVNNTFTKILKPRRAPAAPGSPHAGPFGKSIGYREYAHLAGDLGLALEILEPLTAARLSTWLAGVQYLGKRGSFMQLQRPPEVMEALDPAFVVLNGVLPTQFPLQAVMQQVDDSAATLSFQQMDVYDDTPMKLGRDRVLHPAILPYEMVSSSRAFTHYQLREEE